MRSYFYSTKQAYTNGLSPMDEVSKDAAFLTTCLGAKPTEYGLIGEEAIVNPVSGTYDADAQFIVGERVYLLYWTGAVASIYWIDESDWSKSSPILTAGAALNAATNSSTASLVNDELPFSIATKDNFYFISNSECFLTNCGLFSSWAVGLKATVRVPQACCFWGDRLVLGGFQTAKSYSTTFWTALWAAWKNSNRGNVFTSGDTADDTYLWIGPPLGAADDKPFALDMLMLTEYQVTGLDSMLFDLVDKGLATFVQVPVGEILAVKTNGDQILVYGDTGVYSVRQQEDGTFRAGLLHSSGIPSRAAVDGDSHVHGFVDRRGDLYWYTGEGGLNRHGFRDHISDLTAASIRMPFHRTEGWYVNDGTTCYVLTREGKLWQAGVMPNSIVERAGTLYGTVSGSTGSIVAETEPTDLDTNELKKIEHVHVDHKGLASVYTNIGYRYNSTGSLSYTGNQLVNSDDIGYHGISAKEFTVKVTASGTSVDTLTGSRVSYQVVGARATRGLSEQGSEGQRV